MAQAANDASGDGTTTATILAREIFRGGCEAVAAGLKPMEICKGIKLATEKVREYLLRNSRSVRSADDIYHVASISANGDETIGRLIAQAMEKVGREGTITINEGRSMEHTLQVVEGYEFDRGYVSPCFATDARTLKCEMENPYVLLVEDKLSSVQALVPLLEEAVQSQRELLIVAEDIESELLATLVLNRLRGGLKVCAVRAPGFGESRKRQMEDLAILTGGTVASKTKGVRLESLKLRDLGQVKKATVTKDTTLILEGRSERKAVQERIETLKYQIDQSSDALSEYERTKLKERIGKLSGGVAVIQVGGSSELEVAEAKERLEDALCATRAAVESGILPGGGTALLFAAKELQKMSLGTTVDQTTGVEIVRKACLAPTKAIASNSGEEGAVVARHLLG